MAQPRWTEWANPLAWSSFLAFMTRCVPLPRLAGGFLWRWDPSSPTTFSPCGLSRPSPDSLCVCRREPEGPEEATPSIRRLAWQARIFLGSPPPARRS